MIIFENERIKKIKIFLKENNIENIKKENFIQRHENGWGIHTIKKEFIFFEDLTEIILFSLPKKTYIAHEHLTDMDDEYYHYIIKCNDDCGIIIENEYLKYYKGLLFGFNPMNKHIVWNNGDEDRESLIFIFKNKKLSLEEWQNKKNEIAKRNFEDTRNLTNKELNEMINKFNVKIQ
jgi:hypothetical protein